MPPIITIKRLPLLARLLVNSLAQAGTAIAAIFLLRAVFQGFVEPTSRSDVVWLALGIAAVAMARSLLRVAERVDSERLGQDYVGATRSALFDRLSTTTPAWLMQRSQGVLMVRFATDLNGIRLWVGNGMPRLIVGLIASVAAIGALCVISLPLGLITVVVVSLTTVAGAIVAVRFRSATTDLRRRRGQLASNTADRILSISTVRLSGQAPRERRRIDRQSVRLISAATTRRFYGSVIGALPELGSGVAIAIAVISQISSGNSAGSVADLVAVVAVIGLLSTYSQDIARGATAWNTYRVARIKLNQVFDAPVHEGTGVSGEKSLIPMVGRLRFDSVSFEDVFDGLTFELEPNTVTAITGPNGSGKSLAIEIAAGLVKPDSGAVEIDGVDIASIDASLLAQSVGVVSSQIPLVRGSWRRNLTFRSPDSTDSEVTEIIERVGLTQHVATLRRGLRTQISYGGAGMPSGIRQRIFLARALIGGTKVLLLDDPDIHLDADGRRLVAAVLNSRQYTVLIATNEADRIENADKMITLPTP